MFTVRVLTSLFLRAFVLVTLTAMNVRQIAGGRYLGAFVCGAGISAVWYVNVGNASHDRRAVAAAAYALGAGAGTLFGMWLTR